MNFTFFIFTHLGKCFISQGETITKAISAHKKTKPRGAGEIVGVIRAASEMEIEGRARRTHVLGVVCAFAEDPAVKAAEAAKIAAALKVAAPGQKQPA